MSDLAELYQDVILDHGKRPRNLRAIDGAEHVAEGFNPLCGDHLTVYVKGGGDGGAIEDISFTGSGCAICTASASLMTQHLAGATAESARQSFSEFQALLTGSGDPPASLGKLAALSGVRRYPMRVKCATLPWHTMKAALEGRDQPVSTET